MGAYATVLSMDDRYSGGVEQAVEDYRSLVELSLLPIGQVRRTWNRSGR